MSFYQDANSTNPLTMPTSDSVHAKLNIKPRFYSSASTPIATRTSGYSYSFAHQLGVAFIAMALTVMMGLIVNPSVWNILSLWL